MVEDGILVIESEVMQWNWWVCRGDAMQLVSSISACEEYRENKGTTWRGCEKLVNGGVGETPTGNWKVEGFWEKTMGLLTEMCFILHLEVRWV